MARVTLKGLRASTGSVTGPAVKWEPGQDLKKIQEGSILVTKMTTPEVMPVMDKIVGLVTEVGGITSHAAVVGRGYGLPVVVACKGAGKIMTGDMVTIQADVGEVVIESADKQELGGEGD